MTRAVDPWIATHDDQRIPPMREARSKKTRYSAEEVEAACGLYLSGLSLRQVTATCGVGHYPVRKLLGERGQIRGRLDRHASLTDRLNGGYDIAANSCWIWRGVKNNMGYGMTSDNGRRVLAHRAMCKLVGREVPPHLDACHHCDNPACVNPDHIFSGTRADNMQDAARKDRVRFGEQSSSAKLTEIEVAEVRRLYEGGMRQRHIAKLTGIDYRHVHAIVHRRIWRRSA